MAPVTRQVLERSFKFAIDFHLEPSKGQANRTSGQTRGLGGVVDSFLVGKVIESGVVDILKKMNNLKEFELDFEIHKTGDASKAGDADPDIVGVKEKGQKRPPKVFVEIKNTGESDRWIGLHEEQFQTIKRNTIVHDDLKKIFIIYASIKSKKEHQLKRDDLLGVFLKSKIESALFNGFSDIEDLYIGIDYVMSAQELFDHGTRFEKGHFFYETEIFEKSTLKNRDGFKPYKSNILPKFCYIKQYPYPEKYGNIEYEGTIEIWEKENEKSNRLYVYCISDVKIRHKVLGNFNLEKNCVYKYVPMTIGRNPTLNRNNIWIAKRNLHNVLKTSTSDRIKEIASII